MNTQRLSAALSTFLLCLGLGLAAKGSVEASTIIWCSAAVLLFAAAYFQETNVGLSFTPLAGAIFGYAAWLVVTNLWVNPYNAAASYDGAFVVAGYLIGWRAGRTSLKLLFALALLLAIGLAGWSIAQLATGIADRGHAIFETPAILAATINLVLAPGLVLVAAGRRDPWLLASLAVLAAALAGTGSRGGWLALSAAAVIAWLFFRRAGVAITRESAFRVAAIVLVGIGLSLLTPLNWNTAFGTAQASGAARLGLYEAAIKALTSASPLLGSGYMDFRYVMEAQRPSIPGYENAITYFVHNDYLQALLELGVPGAALLILVAGLPPVTAWRALPRAAHDRTVIIALVTATASMAMHAVVDFPFHIPICLIMYGACAGLLSRLERLEEVVGKPISIPRQRMVRMARAAIVGGGIWIVIKPAAADAAVEHARAQWRTAAGADAAYWFEVARRIEPRDWRFHFYAGMFWYAQAEAGAKGTAARLADRAFEAGFNVHPHEVSNLVWRIGTHIYLRKLLAEPADARTLRAWADQAHRLAPLDREVMFYRHLVERFETQPSAP